MCVPKGTEMPELKEGVFSFHWFIDFRTAEGQMHFTEGSHTGRYKTYDAAHRGCQDEARRALDLPRSGRQPDLRAHRVAGVAGRSSATPAPAGIEAGEILR